MATADGKCMTAEVISETVLVEASGWDWDGCLEWLKGEKRGKHSQSDVVNIIVVEEGFELYNVAGHKKLWSKKPPLQNVAKALKHSNFALPL